MDGDEAFREKVVMMTLLKGWAQDRTNIQTPRYCECTETIENKSSYIENLQTNFKLGHLRCVLQ
jgi:hypothetical protein